MIMGYKKVQKGGCRVSALRKPITHMKRAQELVCNWKKVSFLS